MVDRVSMVGKAMGVWLTAVAPALQTAQTATA
jgi:hypothetical protein